MRALKRCVGEWLQELFAHFEYFHACTKILRSLQLGLLNCNYRSKLLQRFDTSFLAIVTENLLLVDCFIVVFKAVKIRNS